MSRADRIAAVAILAMLGLHLAFCHGVMLAWSEPALRWLALAETLLASLLVVSASWDGLRARSAARRARPPAV